MSALFVLTLFLAKSFFFFFPHYESQFFHSFTVL